MYWIKCVLSNKSKIYKDIVVAWKMIIIWAKGKKQDIQCVKKNTSVQNKDWKEVCWEVAVLCGVVKRAGALEQTYGHQGGKRGWHELGDWG